MQSMAERLKAAKKRNPDAYKIIGVVSGYGEKRIKEIARNYAYDLIGIWVSLFCCL